MNLHRVVAHLCNCIERGLALLHPFHKINLRDVLLWKRLQPICVLKQKLKSHLAWCIRKIGGNRGKPWWEQRRGCLRHVVQVDALLGANGDREANGVTPL
jgi:hypothetical protein